MYPQKPPFYSELQNFRIKLNFLRWSLEVVLRIEKKYSKYKKKIIFRILKQA